MWHPTPQLGHGIQYGAKNTRREHHQGEVNDQQEPEKQPPRRGLPDSGKPPSEIRNVEDEQKGAADEGIESQ